MYKIIATFLLCLVGLRGAWGETVTFTARVDQSKAKILVDVTAPSLAGQSGQVTFGASWKVSQSGSLVSGGAIFDSVIFGGGGASSVNANSVAMDVTATTTIPSSGLIATLSFTPTVSTGTFKLTPYSSGVFVSTGVTFGYQTTLAPPDLVFSFSNLNKTLTISNAGGGVVTSSPAGINCGSICVFSFGAGTGVTLTATPSPGYIFSGWSSNAFGCLGTFNCFLTMSADQSVTALFTQIVPPTPTPSPTPTPTPTPTPSPTPSPTPTPTPPTLRALMVSVNGSGSVVSAPSGINCQSMAKCDSNFNDGTVVTLMATPAAGTTFTGWGGDCSGKSTCMLTLSSNKQVTATFSPLSILTVNTVGSGKITSSPSGIDCGTTCSTGFTDGTSVVLTATPSNDYSFAGWSGGACSGTGTCTMTIAGAQSVTATFNPPARPSVPLEVAAVAGNQKVLVTWKASQGIVTSYTATSINAAGDAASQKSCSAQTPTTSCEILGLSNGVLYRFTVVATGPGGTSDPSALSDWSIPATSSLVGQCGTASGILTNTSPNPLDLCLAGYPNTPSKDSTGRFNWICYGAGGGALINCASGGPLPIYPAPNVTVSVAVSSPSGKSGTIKSDPFGIDCGLRCDYSFTKNQRITLTVTPLPGAVFNGWSGACNNKKLSCSFAPKKNLKVTAKFK